MYIENAGANDPTTSLNSCSPAGLSMSVKSKMASPLMTLAETKLRMKVRGSVIFSV